MAVEKISILVADVSANAMARTCPIAKALEERYEVEMVGFDGGGGFFEPYAGEFDTCVFDRPSNQVSLMRKLRQADRAITGDALYAFRPCLGSYGLGLLHRHRTGKKLVLDIEDLCLGFSELSWYKKLYHATVWGNLPDNGFYTEVLKRHADRADALTVTSSYLQDKYGGTRLPYGPDADEFSPQAAKVPEIEDISNSIVFVGTVREHKGLDVLAEAISRSENDVNLVIAGYDPSDIIPELKEIAGDSVRFIGPIEHERVPNYLNSADMIVIPQKDTQYTQAQIPNKLFEAMSMGKPIIASSTADIPEILGAAGLTVPPGDPEALAGMIDRLIDDPQEAATLGRRARDRYLEKYSRECLGEKLEQIIGMKGRDQKSE